MIAPASKSPLDAPRLIDAVVAALTDEELADFRALVLGLHSDLSTDDDQRNEAVRKALLETLRTAASVVI